MLFPDLPTQELPGALHIGLEWHSGRKLKAPANALTSRLLAHFSWTAIERNAYRLSSALVLLTLSYEAPRK